SCLLFSLCFCSHLIILFFFIDTAPTELYTLSLHDALPILPHAGHDRGSRSRGIRSPGVPEERRPLLDRTAPAGDCTSPFYPGVRSEEHTSELQSRENLVCRLLLEKKKK